MWGCLLVFFLMCSGARAEQARGVVQQAVRAELAADKNDHSEWLYRESDRRPGNDVVEWVAETSTVNVKRVLERNGRHLPVKVQKRQVEAFLHNSGAQAQQRSNAQHDDQQAAALLRMLPDGFRWKVTGHTSTATTLSFEPNPKFHPPTREARVFSAMAGTMTVSDAEHRIVSLQGRMIRNVDFGWGGILGKLRAGGTFAIQRSETAPGHWEITQTHVHIRGRALLFKTISEEEDDVKTEFHRLPDDISLEQAAAQVMQQPE